MTTHRLLIRLLWGMRPWTPQGLLTFLLLGTLLCLGVVWIAFWLLEHSWRTAQENTIREAVLLYEIERIVDQHSQDEDTVFFIDTSFARSREEEREFLQRLEQGSSAVAVKPWDSPREDDKGYNISLRWLEWIDHERLLVHGSCHRVRSAWGYTPRGPDVYLVQWTERGWVVGKVHFALAE
jgi:hypothetical protein